MCGRIYVYVSTIFLSVCFKFKEWKSTVVKSHHQTVRKCRQAAISQGLNQQIFRIGNEISSILKSCLGLFESLHRFSDMV